MARQICLFNHKGGVSKTTTTFNLGWMLADKGKRVMLVDSDPQCNLTGMFLGYKGLSELEKVYSQPGLRNIRDGLAPAFESKPIPLQAVICESLPSQPNLFLLPGHIGLAEYETTLGVAQELSGTLVTLQNLPGALPQLLTLTAEKYDIDMILIDMSPSLGPINQNILSTSDFFLVPMAPDYFSVMATESLSNILPKWKDWTIKAKSNKVLQDATYKLPTCSPKFIGTIIQKYRIRHENTPSTAFQRWIDEVDAKVKTSLVPALAARDMLLSTEKYQSVGMIPGDPVLQMSDFNGLIAQSQKHSAPVYKLTDIQLEQTGIVLERTKKSMFQFATLFSDAAEKVITMTLDA